MDPLSITFGLVGVAGLFSVCMDVLDRVEAYRSSFMSSSQISLRLKAEKLKLQAWGTAAGFENKTLKDTHHPQLDNEDVRVVVEEILLMIRNLFITNEYLMDKLHRSPPTKNGKPISGAAGLPSAKLNDAAMPMRSKIKWTFGHETKLTKNVETLEVLTEKLYVLIPPVDLDLQNHATVNDLQASSDNEKIRLTLLTITEDLSRLAQDHQNLTRTNMIESVDKLLGAKKIRDELEDHLRTKIVGTCDWIFKTTVYNDWISADLTSTRFLWLYGPPGFGKTVLCANVITSLKLARSPYVFHCFASQYADSGAPEDIIRVWISQFARIDQGALDLVYSCLFVTNYRFVLTSSELWEVFRSIISQSKPCIFIVDGLDEFRQAPTKREEFLDNLKTSLVFCSSAVLISSRDEPDIRAQLSFTNEPSGTMKMYSHAITQEDTHDDLSSFSKDMMEKKLAKKDPSLRSSLAERLTDRCDGMFLWLALVGDDIYPSLRAAQLHELVNEVPRGLETKYAGNWQRVLDQGKYKREQGIKILRWLVFGVRILTVGELAIALSIDPNDGLYEFDPSEVPTNIDDDYITTEIKNLCGSLVDVRSADSSGTSVLKTVHLIHLSAKEYLKTVLPSPHPHDLDDGSTRISANHLELAKTCLYYLCCSHTNSDTESKGIPSTEKTFYDYAIENWTVHQNISSLEDSPFHQLVIKFLRSGSAAFSAWASKIESDELSGFDKTGEHEMGSPLYWSAFLGFLPCMQLLFDEDPLSIANIGGLFGTPLQASCAKGHESAFASLLDRGANVNTQAGQIGSALSTSAYYGHEKFVLELINRGSSIHTRDKENRTPLYFAAWGGNAAIVRLLIDHGADVHTLSRNGNSLLHAAVLAKSPSVVKVLLDKNASLDVTNDEDWTPLNSASSLGDVEIVKLLLNRGADLTIPQSAGHTPLYSAAAHGHVDTVRLLLDKGADPESKTSNGLTPLMVAAIRGYPDVARCLLDWGADPNVQGGDWGNTALNEAVTHGTLDVAKLLIERNADTGISSNAGLTPIYIASVKGHLQIVQLLVNTGVDVNRATNNGWTPLQTAVAEGHLEIMRLLLENGAEIDLEREYGWAPLNDAVWHGHAEIIRLLLDKGAKINRQRHNGLTALHDAVDGGQLEAVEILLDRGAEIDIVTSDGWNPLHNASNHASSDIVKLLLSRGADVNRAADEGRIPLRSAVRNGHLETVRLLLDHGAEVNKVDDGGWTCLRSAMGQGYSEIVQLLLDKGAHVNAAEENGRTPLQAAALFSDLGMVQLIHQKGGRVTNEGSSDLVKDYQGRSVFHFAARGGNTEVLDYLLASAPLPFDEDKFGRNIVDYAAMSGSPDMVRAVLKKYKEMNLEFKSSSPWSSLHWAAQKGSYETLSVLVKARVKIEAVETETPNVHWTPFDVAVHYDNRKIVPQNGTEDLLDALRANDLPCSGTDDFNCNGCFMDIYGIRFACKDCMVFDYCFMCKKQSEDAHPGHEWKLIELASDSRLADEP